MEPSFVPKSRSSRHACCGLGQDRDDRGLSGQTGAVQRAHVVTAKAALVGLTKALALEFAEKNITVNTVSPGMIDTVRAGAEPKHHDERRIPVGRLGQALKRSPPRFAFSFPTKRRFITGQTVNVNGGFFCQ